MLQAHDAVHRRATCVAARSDYIVLASGFTALILGPLAVVRVLSSLDEQASVITGLAAVISVGIACPMIAVALLTMFFAPGRRDRARTNHAGTQ
jgi:hypothetical protein